MTNAADLIKAGHKLIGHGLAMLSTKPRKIVARDAAPAPVEVIDELPVTMEYCQNLAELRNDVGNVLATIDSQLAPCYAPGGPLDPG